MVNLPYTGPLDPPLKLFCGSAPMWTHNEYNYDSDDNDNDDDSDDNNDDDDGHLSAGEVSVSEVVEDGVHSVMLATPRGNLVIITTIINNNNYDDTNNE